MLTDTRPVTVRRIRQVCWLVPAIVGMLTGSTLAVFTTINNATSGSEIDLWVALDLVAPNPFGASTSWTSTAALNSGASGRRIDDSTDQVWQDGVVTVSMTALFWGGTANPLDTLGQSFVFDSVMFDGSNEQAPVPPVSAFGASASVTIGGDGKFIIGDASGGARPTAWSLPTLNTAFGNGNTDRAVTFDVSGLDIYVWDGSSYVFLKTAGPNSFIVGFDPGSDEDFQDMLILIEGPVPVTPCTTGAECGDGLSCTLDTCNSFGGCLHDPIICSAGDTNCETFSCDPAGLDGNCDIATPVVDCSVNDTACQSFSCDVGGALGNCDISTPSVDCALNDNACATFACDPAGAPGNCAISTPTVDCSGNTTFCQSFECDPNGAFGNCATAVAVNDGMKCPTDGVFCNGDEVCLNGVCASPGSACSGATPFCCESSGTMETIILDFETEDDYPTPTPLANGQIIDTEFGNLVAISTLGSQHRGATIFDSNNPGPNLSAGDPDLLVNLGNVLILQNLTIGVQNVAGFWDPPNDTPTGGTMVFDFLVSGVEALSVDLIDINGGGQAVQVILVDGAAKTRTFDVPGTWTHDITVGGPNGFDTLDLTTLAPQLGEGGATATASEDPGFNPAGIVKVSVEMFGSGGMDNFKFKRVVGQCNTECCVDADCDDGNPCTVDTCDPSGMCNRPAVDCTANDTACDVFSCDPAGADGNCAISTPRTNCSANDTNCETFACDPAGAVGNCTATTPTVDCSTNDTACATFACDPVNGLSGNCDVVTPTVDCSTNDTNCETFACDPAGAVGNCTVTTPTVDCSTNDTACATFACDPVNGVAGNCDVVTPTVDCSTNDNACQTFACDPAGITGNCDTATDRSNCSTNDTACQTFACDLGGAVGNCDTATDRSNCSSLDTNCERFSCNLAGSAGNCGTVTEMCGACCLPTGGCRDDVTTPQCNGLSGNPLGAGVLCLGDADGNGVDDICPIPAQVPSVSEWGLVIMTLLGLIGGSLIFSGRRFARRLH